MGMKLLQKVRDQTGLKNYSIAQRIRELGHEVTCQGIDGYSKDGAQSIRLAVLVRLRKITGLSWASFGRWLDEEFLFEPETEAKK